ncbi:NAD(P)-dependent oxidoreductase [Streptomyces sp. NRRL F-5123]|uniref:NAD(P)-dependent oxidoreductase n=1 Tax=Streptomyces sp. NRRL F-5123 TaxID=1463856 RepID=UPI0004E23531|nr:NAD(P)H-binding protein [Streptomyces sp. NRRL F-5123]
MGTYVIFGAGGRAGREAVAEARRRGHHVTAVVRDPSRHAALAAEGVRLAAGDVTDPAAVAALAAGHDAAVNTAAVYGEGTDPAAFFPAAARALAAGLAEAGVPRLVTVGLSAVLPGQDGSSQLDSPAFPDEFRPFCTAHAAGLDTLRAEAGALDWLYLAPAGDFVHDAPEPTGRYEPRPHIDPAARITYRDFALALLDEAADPRHHRTHLAVT